MRQRWSLTNNFYYAWSGLRHVVRSQWNARLHLIGAALAVSLGVALNISNTDWRFVVCGIMFVWVVEVLNTAIEHLCDVVSPEYSESVKLAKDVAAGAVFIATIGGIVLAILVFGSYLPF